MSPNHHYFSLNLLYLQEIILIFFPALTFLSEGAHFILIIAISLFTPTETLIVLLVGEFSSSQIRNLTDRIWRCLSLHKAVFYPKEKVERCADLSSPLSMGRIYCGFHDIS